MCKGEMKRKREWVERGWRETEMERESSSTTEREGSGGRERCLWAGGRAHREKLIGVYEGRN